MIIALFLVVDFIGYKFLYHHIIVSHEKDTQILFHKIKNDTSDLLSKLLYKYSTQKDILKQKHKEVLKYLEDKEDILNLDLKEIQSQLNKDTKNNPYNIYITDENYVIKNTTYKPDLGFNLSFAKGSFDEHFKNKVVGCCSPLFEKSSKNFFSFTDSYIVKNGKQKGILQISYNYPETKKQLQTIRDTISKYPNIKDAKAYILVDTGFVNDLILKDFPAYKPTLEEIEDRIKKGNQVKEKLKNKVTYSDNFTKDGKHYKSIYLSTNSAIFDNTKIIYSILLDESEFKKQLLNINGIMAIITIIGIIAIFIITKVREKEIKIKEQDSFVQSSMHEIRTPLSVITLNNELRQNEFGEDEYTTEIDSALKVLQNSYDDMSFIATQNNVNYPIELLDLDEIVEERIDYFKTIAKANDKTIESNIDSECQINISKIELVRLIDNNLSNAVKYSDRNSTINVDLKNELLIFNNTGTTIKDTNKIFSKFFRENNVVGGYGLGLNIVSQIAKKYGIEISLTSDKKSGTTFSYKFKCHTNDI